VYQQLIDDDRTEAVLRRLQQRVPVMSDAEKDALSELKDIQVLLSSYTSKMKTVLNKLYCCSNFTTFLYLATFGITIAGFLTGRSLSCCLAFSYVKIY